MAGPNPPSVNIEVDHTKTDAQIIVLASPFTGFLGVTRIGHKAYSCFDSQAHADAYLSAGRPPSRQEDLRTGGKD